MLHTKVLRFTAKRFWFQNVQIHCSIINMKIIFLHKYNSSIIFSTKMRKYQSLRYLGYPTVEWLFKEKSLLKRDTLQHKDLLYSRKLKVNVTNALVRFVTMVTFRTNSFSNSKTVNINHLQLKNYSNACHTIHRLVKSLNITLALTSNRTWKKCKKWTFSSLVQFYWFRFLMILILVTVIKLPKVEILFCKKKFSVSLCRYCTASWVGLLAKL